MKVELLRGLVMMINYSFCGVSILMWLYLLVNGIVLRISTRSLEDVDRNIQFGKIFTQSLKNDLPVVQKSTRTAFLITGVFLVVVWIFGSTEEQNMVQSLLERTSVWLYFFIGSGIVIGTIMTLIIPSDATVPLEIARQIRKQSVSIVWLAILFFIIIWLIA